MARKRRWIRWAWWLAGLLLLGSAVGSVAWVQRDRWRVAWAIEQALASDRADDSVVLTLTGHPSLAIDGLMDRLERVDSAVSVRAGATLRRLLDANRDPYRPADAHIRLAIAGELRARFDRFPPASRSEAIRLAFEVLRQNLARWSPTCPAAVETAGAVVHLGLTDEDVDVRRSSLTGLPDIWDWNEADPAASRLALDWKIRCYFLAVSNLDSDSSVIRRAAIDAVREAPFHDRDETVFRGIDDPDAEVRVSALRALRVWGEQLTTEQTMRIVDLLRDGEVAVRENARAVLRMRFSDLDIDLVALSQHPDPQERRKIASRLWDAPEIRRLPFLENMLQDPSALVRVEAVKAIRERKVDTLYDKVRELAGRDASPVVREECARLTERVRGQIR